MRALTLAALVLAGPAQAGGLCEVLADRAAPIAAVQAALAEGAVLTGGCYDGYQPLHIAASAGRPDVIAVLAAAGADLQARNQFRNTPLHVAVLAPAPEAVAALAAAGADLAALGTDGLTPRGLAESLGEAAVAADLAALGAP